MEVANGTPVPAEAEAVQGGRGAGRGGGRGRGGAATAAAASAGGRGRGWHCLQTPEKGAGNTEREAALRSKKERLLKELQQVEKAEKKISGKKDEGWGTKSQEKMIDAMRDKKLKKAKQGEAKSSSAPAGAEEVKELSKEAVKALARARVKISEGIFVDQQLCGDPKSVEAGRFHALLKSVWKTIPKEERKKLIAESEAARGEKKKAITSFPFPTKPADHAETSPEAFADVAPLLELLAEKLGKSVSDVALWDPYYCAGASKVHLAALGFQNVHHVCEDFYSVLEKEAAPEHDVVVTNPPNSQSLTPDGEMLHAARLVAALKEEGKPFMLCMPESYASMDFYTEAFPDKKEAPLLMCPYSRYPFWTPEGMRPTKSAPSHKRSGLGIRSQPFVALWYVSLAPVISNKELFKLAKAGSLRGIDVFTDTSEIEKALAPATEAAPRCRLCKTVESLPEKRGEYTRGKEKKEKSDEAPQEGKKRKLEDGSAPEKKKQKVEGGAAAGKEAEKHKKTKRGGKALKEKKEKRKEKSEGKEKPLV